MYVRPPACPEQLGCHWTDLNEIWYWKIFRKTVEVLKFYWSLARITGTLHNGYFTWRVLYMTMYAHLRCLAQFFLKREMFQAKIVEKIKTHILCLVPPLPRIFCLLWDNVEKYGRAGQAADDNIMRRVRCACCVTKFTHTHTHTHTHRDTHTHTQTHILFNTYCTSTATLVMRTRRHVTLSLHCLSCPTLRVLAGGGGVDRERERERESWYSRVSLYVAGLENRGSIPARNRVFPPQSLEQHWIPS
jgi:hypothetical protein